MKPIYTQERNDAINTNQNKKGLTNHNEGYNHINTWVSIILGRREKLKGIDVKRS